MARASDVISNSGLWTVATVYYEPCAPPAYVGLPVLSKSVESRLKPALTGTFSGLMSQLHILIESARVI